ncbi:hypothetical protein TrRE_jg11214, partial [Triparma retinervis]
MWTYAAEQRDVNRTEMRGVGKLAGLKIFDDLGNLDDGVDVEGDEQGEDDDAEDDAEPQPFELEDPDFEHADAGPSTISATRSFLRRWKESMQMFRDDGTLPEQHLANEIITEARAMLFVKHDLQRVEHTERTNRPRFTSKEQYVKNQLRHLSRLYYLGYNEDQEQYNVTGLSDVIKKKLIATVANFFRPVHMFIREQRQKRLPILPVDIELAAESSHFLENKYYQDFATLLLASTTGARRKSMVTLTLDSIKHIVMEADGEILISFSFTNWKRDHPGEAKPKRVSGYIWKTENWRNDIVYHLHRYLLQRTKQKVGLVYYVQTKISIFGYTPEFDERLKSPQSLSELQAGIRNDELTTVVETLRFCHDKSELALWTRASHHSSSMVKVVKKRFAFYPEFILKRFVFHSTRNGFFINAVIVLGHANDSDIVTSMRAACFLGDWRWLTDPNKWYDANGLIADSINMSAITRGEPERMFIRPTEKFTVAYVQRLARDPVFTDNLDFAEKQYKYTVPFVRNMVWVVILKARQNIPGSVPQGWRRNLLKEDAIDGALAYFMWKIYNPDDDITEENAYLRFLHDKANLVLRCHSFLKYQLWRKWGLTHTDMFAYVHNHICLAIYNFEGAPHVPFLRPSDEFQIRVDAYSSSSSSSEDNDDNVDDVSSV